MKFPKKCPKCNCAFGEKIQYVDGRVEIPRLFVRSGLNFDSEDETRIEDQIYECSHCHTLFRARWELVSFVQLEEKRRGK